MESTETGGQMPRTYAVASGKGGVGKTNVTLNLSIALREAGREVLIVDADLGLGNLNVLMGMQPRFTLGDILQGACSLEEALLPGPGGVRILAADSGVEAFTSLSTAEKMRIFSLFHRCGRHADILLVDTASGISSNVLFFAGFAHQVLLVATPEPTSITDAYATMKVLNRTNGERAFLVLVNQVKSAEQGREVYETLRKASEHFLAIRPAYAGCVFADRNVPRSVVGQKPVLQLYPDSQASRDIRALAERVLRGDLDTCAHAEGEGLASAAAGPAQAAAALVQ